MERRSYTDLIKEVADQVEEAFPWDILEEIDNGAGRTLSLDEADEYFLSRVAPEQLGPIGSTVSAQGRTARPLEPVLSRYHQESEHQNPYGGLRQ
jgi:hypothetical protein